MARRPPSVPVTALWILAASGWPASLSAQGAGPEFWAVTGVIGGKGLNVRAQPSTSSDLVGTLPHDARGVANLGCRGGSSPAADDAERQDAARNRWCRVRYKGVEGWVAARFLKPDPGSHGAEPKAPVGAGPQASAPKTPADPSPPAIAQKPPADPGPPAVVPNAPDSPAPPSAVPKTPVDPRAGTTLSFTCAWTDAIAVMIDDAGGVTHQRYVPREVARLTLSVTTSAPESAGPVATAAIWQLLGQDGERFEGRITWGQAIDARDGRWRLDLGSRTLHVVQAREGRSAQFFRFSCE